MEEVSSSWRSYPRSLPSDVCDPYTFDLEHYVSLLDDNSERLFVADTQLRIKVIEVGEQDLLFSNFSALERYLDSSQFGGTRVILVPQKFSWDHLMISENGLRKLAWRFHIFPAFLDVVQAFGQQTSSKSDSVGGCNSHVRGGISEYCYLVKNVEEHGREDSSDPWSIRQMGVYHQRDSQLDADTFVILNPSIAFQQRLKDAQTHTSCPPTWKDVHMLALSCSTTPWRRYVSYVESQLVYLKTKAHLSTVSEQDGSGTVPKLKIEFGDTQDIQVVHDNLRTVNQVLDSNLRVFKAIASLLSEHWAVQARLSSRQPHAHISGPAFCIAEMEMQSRRVQTLFQRISAASDLMQNIIAFRGLEALKTSSAMSTAMARLAQSDNKLMLDLTAKSRQDARTLKTITILTMIYLPASFVSQFLSMGYIGLHYTHHRVTLHFASEMWIFGILTILLLAMTIGSWLWLEMRRRRRQRSVNQLDCESVGDDTRR